MLYQHATTINTMHSANGVKAISRCKKCASWGYVALTYLFGASLAEPRTKPSPITTTSPLNGGTALSGKSGRKSANAGDTSARQTSMRTAAHFMFAKIKSRQSRVERKALVFFPTLNKRLSSAAFSFDLILAVGRAAYRRSGWGDLGGFSFVT